VRSILLGVVLLSAVSARASAPQGGSAEFAIAYGAAAYAVTTDANATTGRVTVRRLGLDGGVLWEQRYGVGRSETPVGAAVTSWGGLSVLGDNDGGCFAAHWTSNGSQKWDDALLEGSECHARSVLVDADGDTYALGTTTIGGILGATVWKINKLGSVLWSFNPGGAVPRYAFALTLDADGAGVTITTATNGSGAWSYEAFDLDVNGRTR
jgi:hypothetical protein